jgi:CheY-like chemotaxis protein
VQGGRGPDRAEGGLGLGLALVKSLVALHGGSVEARSEGAGRGSEFIVRLPRRDEPAIVREAAAPEAPKAGGPLRRILLVDDNQDAAQALRLLLEADGHEVRVAADGASGLALAKTYRPEVVLLDIGLPKMDGYEIARRIRADAALRDTMLVAVTGYGQMHDRARASASGFHHHLVKPVEYSRLQTLLRAL